MEDFSYKDVKTKETKQPEQIGSDAFRITESGSLGLLALGATGLKIWRTEKEKAAGKKSNKNKS